MAGLAVPPCRAHRERLEHGQRGEWTGILLTPRPPERGKLGGDSTWPAVVAHQAQQVFNSRENPRILFQAKLEQGIHDQRSVTKSPSPACHTCIAAASRWEW